MKNSELNKLTEREFYILELMTEGYENTEIAEKLFVSPHTIKAQISGILRKMEAKNRTQAVYTAMKNGIIE